MKKCPGCTKEKNIELFGIASKRSDGRNAYCLECMREKRLNHYYATKEAHFARNKKTKGKLREIVLNLKNGKCYDCGISYPEEPWLMEFDHRDPLMKTNEISYFVNNGSKSKLIQELEKCDLVCVVCHKRRTAKMFNWIDNRFLN